MNYYEVTFSCQPDNDVNGQVLISLLGETGFESFTENENGIILGYIAESLYSEEAIKNVIENFPFEARITFESRYIVSQNWNEEWEKHFFRPIIIGDKCAIHSSFHQDIPKVKYDIVIDPKMSFGTGHHETTGMMIAWLLKMDLTGRSFLDMGCGTAVLAILASMKGAAPVLAIDNDEWAYNNSIENVQLNRTGAIDVRLGDASAIAGKDFDVIFANINRNILLNDIKYYARCMHSGSELYMSGFYTEDIPLLEEECRKNGLRFHSSDTRNNWASVRFIK